MKALVIVPILFFSLIIPRVDAKVLFCWPNFGVSDYQKSQVTAVFKEIADKYLDERYCSLGPLNFDFAKESFVVQVDPSLIGRSHSNWSSGSGGSVLFLGLDTANDLTAIGAVFAHELSHMYDLAMIYRLRDLYDFIHFPLKYRPKVSARERFEWVNRYMYDRINERNLGEYRAFTKEEQYIDSRRNSWSTADYDNLKSAVLKARLALDNSDNKRRTR